MHSTTAETAGAGVFALARHLQQPVSSQPALPSARPLASSAAGGVCSPGFERLSWSDACKALGQLPLTKYCDYNLVNIVTQNKAKPTLEVRNLPATLDSGWILAVASVIESLLMVICSEDAAQTQERLLVTPPSVESLLAFVEASPAVKAQLARSPCSDSVQPLTASLNT